MSKILKSVELFTQPSATRAASTYAVPNYSMPYLYTSANWNPAPEIYFEAVIMSSDAGSTASIELYDGSAQVTGSELQTNGTTPTRLRSANIAANFVNGTTYQVRIKRVSGSITVTLYAARLIFIQNGTITATETIVHFGNTNNTTSLSYVDDTQKFYFNYDSSKFNGTITTYFEAYIANNSTGTSYVQLVGISGGAVSGSEVQTTGTSLVRVRSGAITLASDTYKVQYKASANTCQFRTARIIIVQTNTPTLTETYIPLRIGYDTATSTPVLRYSNFYWDNEDWSVGSKTVLWDAVSNVAGGGDISYTDLWNGASADATVSINATVETQSSVSVTPTDNTTYDARIRNSDTSTVSFYGSMLRVQANLATAGTKIPQIMYNRHMQEMS